MGPRFGKLEQGRVNKPAVYLDVVAELRDDMERFSSTGTSDPYYGGSMTLKSI